MSKPENEDKSKLKKFVPYGVVILVAALSVLLVTILTKPEEKIPEETTAETTEETTTETETEAPFPTASALDVFHIETLMNTYYEAKVNNDVETLNQIIESDTKYTLADLTGESQYIERYDNFRNYVAPGLAEEYFVVYVTYELYFCGIDTGAPALNRFIIAKDTSGNYFIYDRKVSQEFENYLAELDASPTITGLREEVETNLKAACAADSDLNELIRLLTGKEDETSVPENATTPEEESGTQEGA